jgi:hypothetical protein
MLNSILQIWDKERKKERLQGKDQEYYDVKNAHNTVGRRKKN